MVLFLLSPFICWFDPQQQPLHRTAFASGIYVGRECTAATAACGTNKRKMKIDDDDGVLLSVKCVSQNGRVVIE